MNPIVKTIGAWIVKRSPGILTGLGIAGMVTGAVMMAKAAPKANLAVDNATTEKGEDLTRVEKAKVLVKQYWKPATVIAVSAIAIVGGAAAGAKKRAALEAALSLTTTALTTQTSAITEKYGPQALEALQAIASGKRIEETVNNPVDIPKKGLLKKSLETKKEAMDAHDGTQMYWDAWRGVPFETTPTRIISAVAEANKLLRRQDELTMNEFYSCLDIKQYEDEDFTCRMGDKFGWSNATGPIELEYKIIGNKTVDGREYLIMGFNHQPVNRLYS